MNLKFSIIIPVYNRPNEVDELLFSLTKQTYNNQFEVIVVDDGSALKSKDVVLKYKTKINVKYFYKENTGAGLSRNFGMQQAEGNYFIIFDSDCIIPPKYLEEVNNALKLNYTDAFGGSDAAHNSFTIIQKAINFSMTSFLTTGGIRGNKKSIDKFQPRSFNFGISKIAFEVTNGFSKMKIGEDIDLSFRLWENNFQTQFIENAFVYHKRRTNFKEFFKQTFAFGKGRPYLNKKYPNTTKITYWFPSVFIFGLILSILFCFFGCYFFISIYGFYFTMLFLSSLHKTKNLIVAFMSIFTTLIQFLGYGLGYIVGIFKNY